MIWSDEESKTIKFLIACGIGFIAGLEVADFLVWLAYLFT